MVSPTMSTASLLLRDEALVFPAIVSLICAWQLGQMAKTVGALRSKFKITPPAVTGDPAFERGFRAQQNTLEFIPMFMILLWVSAKFFNPVLASLAGLLYIKGRANYFSGYCASAQGRLPGFHFCIRIIMVMMSFCVVGLIHTILTTYFNINILEISGLSKYIPIINEQVRAGD